MDKVFRFSTEFMIVLLCMCVFVIGYALGFSAATDGCRAANAPSIIMVEDESVAPKVLKRPMPYSVDYRILFPYVPVDETPRACEPIEECN